MTQAKKLLMVFDFDHTIVNANTDGVVQHIPGVDPVPQKLKDRIDDIGWTKFMQEVFNWNHEHDVTKEDYFQTLDKIEFTPGFLQLLKTLKQDHGADLMILSDSNSVFIDRILSRNHLEDVLSLIHI